jgi:PKD repeat protein
MRSAPARGASFDQTPASFADGFEAATLDPFWTTSQTGGTVSITSALAHSGTHSLAFTAVSPGPNLQLTHAFASPTKGSFSVYYYDAAPGQQTLYEQMLLLNSNQPGLLAAIGTNDFDAFCYMSRLDDGHGGTQGPNASCGVFPQTQTTNVHRTLGWHLLTIDVRAADVVFSIDGVTTFTATGDYAFDSVVIFMSGPSFRPLTSSYIDDFNFTPPATANRPPTSAPGGPYTGSEGTALAFSGTGSFDLDGDALTFAWNFGDGTTATGASPTHTYADNGTYTATLTVSDGNGGSDSKSAAVTIGNVAPTVTSFSVPAQAQLINGAASAQVTAIAYTDPAGAVDAPFTTSIDCGNQTIASPTGVCAYAAVGTYTISVRVTDKDGDTSAPKTASVVVAFQFNGFFQPVDNPPTRNIAKAGSAIPVKFSLGGDYGLGILAAGYPAVVATGCDSNVPTSEIDQTVAAGGSSLTYDTQSMTYTYVWKSDKAWAGTCRQLIVKLVDGTEHRATFYFK